STYSMPKFLLTGYADKENAVKAINDVGLYQYVEKPWENQDLKLAIQQGLEKRVLLEMLEKRIEEADRAHRKLLEVQRKVLKILA
ncbi:MAG: hypothetical protein JSV78_06245, partial [Phycisphaerales bacterium]